MVKYGGNAMVDETLKRAFAEDIVFLRFAGFKPSSCTAADRRSRAMLDQLGIESEFRGGLRVTTPEAMDVVRMVLVGQVQRELVGLINEHGPLAVGLSGEDAGLFTAEPDHTVVDGEEVDLGLVGEVVDVRPEAVRRPRRGRADPGGLQRRARLEGRCTTSTPTPPRRPSPWRWGGEAARADRRGGALPRLARRRRTSSARSAPRRSPRCCPTLDERDGPQDAGLPGAVRGGVPRATVVDGREPHAVLLEMFTNEGVGTQVLPDVETKTRRARAATSEAAS